MIFKKKEKNVQDKKAPITQQKIFKIMFTLTVAISAVFFLKNLLGGAAKEALMIGATVIVFAVVFLFLKLNSNFIICCL